MKIEEIIGLYNTRVQSVIRKFFDNDIEDVEQEVYIKTWKNLSNYRGDANFWSWLNKITVNTCKDRLRKKSPVSIVDNEEEQTHQIQDKTVNLENKAIFTERHEIILKSINKLNPKFREVIILHDIDDLTCEEISQKIKCPAGTVKSRLFNARKILRQELSELLT